LGFYGHFVGGATNVYAHTGFVRNHLDNTWYLFSNIPEPSGNTINLASANIVYDTLKLGNVNAVSTVTVNGTELFANVSGLYNSITGANTAIQNISANLGGYYVYANANVGSLQDQILGSNVNISNLQSNIGSYYIWANANVAGLQSAITGANSSIQTLSANIGSYYTWANANVGAIYNTVTTHSTWLGNLQANVYSNVQMLANLAAAGNPITIGSNLTVGGNLTSTSTVVNSPGENLFLTSTTISSWTTSGMTVTTGQTDPFGGTNAMLWNDGTANSLHSTYIYTNNVVGAPYTFSIYAKSSGTANPAGYIAMNQYAAYHGVIWNLATGTASQLSSDAFPLNYTSSNLGNGWWRFTITDTAVNSVSAWEIGMVNSTGSPAGLTGGGSAYTGTNQTVYIYNPQLEYGYTALAPTVTTSSAIYNTPKISFSNTAASIGMDIGGNINIAPVVSTGSINLNSNVVVGGNAIINGGILTLGTSTISGNTVLLGNNTVAVNANLTVNGSEVVQNVYLQGNNTLVANISQWSNRSGYSTTFMGNVDPTGGTGAGNIVLSGSGPTYVYNGIVGSTNNELDGQPYTFSIYLKAGALTTVNAQFQFPNGTNAYQINFNLSDGTATVGAGNPGTYSMVNVGNGWYRCTITTLGTQFGAGQTPVVQLTPSGSSGYFYAYGAQVELGYVASPYTPTTTTAVTQYNSLSVPYGNVNLNNAIQNNYGGNVDITANALVLSSGQTSITTLTPTATGNLYTSAPTVTISAPTSLYGTTATANANIGVVFIGNITSQGSFYTPGQILTMVGLANTFSNATFTITSVGNGVGGTGNVTSISLLTAGSLPFAPANPVSFTVNTGGGTGIQANLYYGVNTPVITNSGSGYVEQPTITFVGGGGAGASAYATVGSPNTIMATGANLSIVLPQGEVVKFVTSNVIAGVNSANAGITANTLTATALTGNAIAAGGMGVVGNIYGTSRIGFTNVANSSSAAYTVYNSVYNSVDLIFGA
jgi:hypothetical protein